MKRILWRATILAVAWALTQPARAQNVQVAFGQEASDEPGELTFQAIPLGIRVERRAALHPCCLQFAPIAEVKDRVVRITEIDQGGPCACPDESWHLFVEIRGLEPGAYDVFVKKEGGQLLGTLTVSVPNEVAFLRGHARDDGRLDLADAIAILDFLYLNGPPPPCMEAADVNDDGRVDLGDAIYLLSYLFAEGPAPPEPHLAPGQDPTPDELNGSGPGPPVRVADFLRGEISGDGWVDLSDALVILLLLHSGGEPTPYCLDAADLDDDGRVTQCDVCLAFALWFGSVDCDRFSGLVQELKGCEEDACPESSRNPIPPPCSVCGPDPTPDTLGCEFRTCW